MITCKCVYLSVFRFMKNAMRLESSRDRKPPSHKILIWYMYKHPYKTHDLANGEDVGHSSPNMKEFLTLEEMFMYARLRFMQLTRILGCDGAYSCDIFHFACAEIQRLTNQSEPNVFCHAVWCNKGEMSWQLKMYNAVRKCDAHTPGRISHKCN